MCWMLPPHYYQVIPLHWDLIWILDKTYLLTFELVDSLSQFPQIEGCMLCIFASYGHESKILWCCWSDLLPCGECLFSILLTMKSSLWFGTSSSTKYIALPTFTWFLGDSFMMSLHSRCKLLIAGMSKYTASRTLTRTCKVVLENWNKQDRNQSVVRCFRVMIYTLERNISHWYFRSVLELSRSGTSWWKSL